MITNGSSHTRTIERLPDSGRDTLARLLALSTIAGALLVSVAAFLLSAVPYHTIAALILSSTAGGSTQGAADSLAGNFHGILERLRVCGALFAVAAAVLAGARRWFESWIRAAVIPLPRLIGSAGRRCVQALSEDGISIRIGLLVVMVLALALRVRFLFDPVSFDEADTLTSYAGRPLYIGLSWYPQPNNHLLHTLLLHVTARVLGEAEWSIRIPALCAGLALIPATYFTAKTLYDRYVAIIAAAIVAAAPPLVAYSVNARGYTLLCLFVLMMVSLASCLLDRSEPCAWLLWSLVAALGLYTIPTMIYAIVMIDVWLVLSSALYAREGIRLELIARLISYTSLAVVFGALLYTPVFLATGVGAVFGNSYVRSRSLLFFLQSFPEGIVATWRFFTADLPRTYVLVMTIAATASVVRHQGNRVHAAPVLYAALSLPVLLAVQRVVPFPRIWLFLIPLLSIAAADGLWRFTKTVLRTESTSHVATGIGFASFLAIAASVLGGTSVSARSTVPDAKLAVQWIGAHLQPGDIIFTPMPSSAPLAYYVRRNRIPLKSRPAPCDPMSVVNSVGGWFTRWPAPDSSRVFVLVPDEYQTLASSLRIGCLDPQADRYHLVWSTRNLHLYERRARPTFER